MSSEATALGGSPIRKTLVIGGIGLAIYNKDLILTLLAGQFNTTSDSSTSGAEAQKPGGGGRRDIPDWYFSDWFQNIMMVQGIASEFIMSYVADRAGALGMTHLITTQFKANARASAARAAQAKATQKAARAAAIVKIQTAVMDAKASALAKIQVKLAAVRGERVASLAEIRANISATAKNTVQQQRAALINQIKANSAESAKIHSANVKAEKAALKAADMAQVKAGGAITAEQQRNINLANAQAKASNENRVKLIGANGAKTSKISMANLRFKIQKAMAKAQAKFAAFRGAVKAYKFSKIPSARGTIKAGASIFGVGVMVYDLVRGFYPMGIPPYEDPPYVPPPVRPELPNMSLPLCKDIETTVDGLHAKLCRAEPPKSFESYPSFPGNKYLKDCMPGYEQAVYGQTSRCIRSGPQTIFPGTGAGIVQRYYYGEHFDNLQNRVRVNDWAFHMNDTPLFYKYADGADDFIKGNGLRAYVQSSQYLGVVKPGADPDYEFTWTSKWHDKEKTGYMYTSDWNVVDENITYDYPQGFRDAEIKILGGEILTPMQKLTQLFPEMSEADKIAVIAELPPEIPD